MQIQERDVVIGEGVELILDSGVANGGEWKALENLHPADAAAFGREDVAEFFSLPNWRRDFHLGECYPERAVVKVELTGRSVRFDAPCGPSVRVRVTLVGDGEPDETVGGWVLASSVGFF